MKIMQVFDCTDMPSDVREAFYSRYENVANDCYVNWDTDECIDVSYEIYDVKEDAKIRLVDAWLHSQAKELDSSILIKHWW